MSSVSNISLIGRVVALRNLVSNEVLDSFKKYTSLLPFNQASTVFRLNTADTVVDEAVRKSETLTVESDDVCKYVEENLLKAPAFAEQGLILRPARKHVTFIKYNEGGFFDWHRDFEKIVINDRRKWLEMHLVYCISGCDAGGALSVKSVTGVQTDYNEVATANACVLFDKNLEHAAAVVEKGTKLIMTVDVLVSTPALQSEQNQYIDSNIFHCPPSNDMPGILVDYTDEFWSAQLENGAMLTHCAFRVFRINEDVIIVDCDGVYYVRSGHFDSDGENYVPSGQSQGIYRGGRTEVHEALHCEEGMMNIIENVMYNCVQGEVYNYDSLFNDAISGSFYFCEGALPIPAGTPAETILGLPAPFGAVEEMKTLNYTFVCNEGDQYGTLNVKSLCGVLYNARKRKLK